MQIFDRRGEDTENLTDLPLLTVKCLKTSRPPWCHHAVQTLPDICLVETDKGMGLTSGPFNVIQYDLPPVYTHSMAARFVQLQQLNFSNHHSDYCCTRSLILFGLRLFEIEPTLCQFIIFTYFNYFYFSLSLIVWINHLIHPLCLELSLDFGLLLLISLYEF